mmetsp:Transcript_12497/g.29531  ORF Transcript_12497/g.29531 Transcript_12497/m.29531 type:complete len:290 (+) Transcript_12497:777-1646(+)
MMTFWSRRSQKSWRSQSPWGLWTSSQTRRRPPPHRQMQPTCLTSSAPSCAASARPRPGAPTASGPCPDHPRGSDSGRQHCLVSCAAWRQSIRCKGSVARPRSLWRFGALRKVMSRQESCATSAVLPQRRCKVTRQSSSMQPASQLALREPWRRSFVTYPNGSATTVHCLTSFWQRLRALTAHSVGCDVPRFWTSSMCELMSSLTRASAPWASSWCHAMGLLCRYGATTMQRQKSSHATKTPRPQVSGSCPSFSSMQTARKRSGDCDASWQPGARMLLTSSGHPSGPDGV